MRLALAVSVVLWILSAACGRTAVGGLEERGTEGSGPLDEECEPELRPLHRVTLVGEEYGTGLLPFEQGFLGSRRTRDGGETLFRVRVPGTPREEGTVAGGEILLIDADEHTSMFIDSKGSQTALQIEHQNGSVRISEFGAGNNFGIGSYLSGFPRRFISGNLVAYCGIDGTSLHVLDLLRGTDSVTQMVDGIACQPPIFMEGSDLVLTTWDVRFAGRQVIVHHRTDDPDFGPRNIIHGRLGTLGSAAIWRGQLYYLHEGALVQQDLEPDALPTTLSDGPCDELDVGPSGVVATCEGTGDHLVFFDGESVRRLDFADSNGGLLLRPRVGAALPHGPAFEVAPLHAPCTTCGVAWPETALAVRGNVMTFNYDAASTSRPNAVALGAALIGPGCEP